MASTSETQRLKLGKGRIEGRYRLVGAHLVSVAIWAMVASIFLLDILTPPDNISVCFAYAIPVFVSLFERRPRPVFYASIATALILVGSLVQPVSNIGIIAAEANRLIAFLAQWLVAILVVLQQRRLLDMQEKAEYQHRFVDIISHEVGTALTAVVGQAHRLTKLSEQLAPSDVRLRADKIRKAAERIETIVDRVKFASSLGDGTIPIEHRSINIHTMMQQLVEQLKEEQRVESIELNLCPEPQMVRGDEMLLRQLFENVIVNSIKYSSRDVPISISITKNASASRISIVDRGSGIPPNELPRVREAYYRGENSKGTSGAGLGLYFVERIVEAHKGRLFIESEGGKGTKIVIDLPLSTDAAPS